MMKEIHGRGPIACGVDAMPLVNYTGGIITTLSNQTTHTISVVGWNTHAEEGLYWIVRNTFGEYWGEQGFFNVKNGALAMDTENCVWAVPKDFTVPERHNQYHCFVNGSNCRHLGFDSFPSPRLIV